MTNQSLVTYATEYNGREGEGTYVFDGDLTPLALYTEFLKFDMENMVIKKIEPWGLEHPLHPKHKG